MVFEVYSGTFTAGTRFTPVTSDEDSVPNPDSLSSPDTLAGQVAQLIRLVRTGEEANIKLAFLLAEGLGHPPAFQAYLERLLPLYQLAFEHTPAQLEADALGKLFQLTRINISQRGLTALPENIGALQNLQSLDCSENQLPALPESLAALHNLRELNCAANQLQAMPESIGKLYNLQALDCAGNQLQALPESLESYKT